MIGVQQLYKHESVTTDTQQHSWTATKVTTFLLNGQSFIRQCLISQFLTSCNFIKHLFLEKFSIRIRHMSTLNSREYINYNLYMYISVTTYTEGLLQCVSAAQKML